MAVDLKKEALKAGKYPKSFNKREAKLLESVQHFVGFQVVAAAKYTTVGGSATENITVNGVLATDLVLAVLNVAGATPRTISRAQTAPDQVQIHFSGDPSNDHVVSYIVLRSAV